MLAALLEACSPGTLLCAASDLSLPSEQIRTRTISAWRSSGHAIGKRPTVFLLLSGS
jgi:16S rRNA (cytidine1402-2'-O)-methyltransferase